MNTSDVAAIVGSAVGLAGLFGTVLGWLGRGLREQRLREKEYVLRAEFERWKAHCENQFTTWEALWVTRSDK